jgi:hypothetical protein
VFEVAGCPRQIYHRLVGDVPAPGDPRGDDYGRGGDAAHDVVRRMLNEYGFTVGDVVDDAAEMRETRAGRREFQTEDGTVVALTARIDGSIMLPEGKALLEIKSVGSYAYRQMRGAFTRGGVDGLAAYIHKVEPKYVWQCEVGMRVHDFERAYLVIYDRETCNTGVHSEKNPDIRVGGIVIDRNDELWAEIMPKCARITKAVQARKPPRPAYLDGSRECGWCSFRAYCHGAVKG